MAYKFCPECGFKFDKVYKFCPECGFKLDGEVAPAPAASPAKSSGAMPKVLNTKTAANKADESLNFSFEEQLEGAEAKQEKYEKELKRAYVHCKRGMFDQASLIYEGLVNKKFNDINAYIGFLRISTVNFTKLEGEQIEGDINALFNVLDADSNPKDDQEFIEFLKKKGLYQKWYKQSGGEEKELQKKKEAYREEVYKKLFGKLPSEELFSAGSLEKLSRYKKVDAYIAKEEAEQKRKEEARRKKELEEKRIAEEKEAARKAKEAAKLAKIEAEKRAKEEEKARKEAEKLAKLEAAKKAKEEAARQKEYIKNLYKRKSYKGRNTLVEVTIKDLESYEVPEGVVVIAWNAFKGCTNVKTITLSSTLTEIEKTAFDDCKNLSAINIENTSIETITETVLHGWDKSTSLTLNEKINTISSQAFKNFSNLKTLDLSKTQITELTTYALEGLTNLTKIILPPLVKNVSGLWALKNLECVEISGSSIYSSKDGVLYGTTYNNKKIVYFPCKKKAEKIDLSSFNVECIGEKAFAYNDYLKEVVLPSKIVKIDEYAFTGCEKLEKIKLSNVKEIGKYAFYNCAALKEVKIIDDAIIEEGAFKNCKGLEKAWVGKGVQLKKEAFFNCEKLQTLELSENMLIHAFAFSYCAALKNLLIKRDSRILEESFFKCENIKSVVIEDNCKIYNSAFSGCSMLEKAVVGDNCNLGPFSFANLHNLKDASLGENATVQNDAFYNSTGLEKISFKQNTTIKVEAFRNCKNLTEVSFETNTTIEKGAFTKTALRSVEIPKGCKVAPFAFPLLCLVKFKLFGKK